MKSNAFTRKRLYDYRMISLEPQHDNMLIEHWPVFVVAVLAGSALLLDSAPMKTAETKKIDPKSPCADHPDDAIRFRRSSLDGHSLLPSVG